MVSKNSKKLKKYSKVQKINPIHHPQKSSHEDASSHFSTINSRCTSNLKQPKIQFSRGQPRAPTVAIDWRIIYKFICILTPLHAVTREYFRHMRTIRRSISIQIERREVNCARKSRAAREQFPSKIAIVFRPGMEFLTWVLSDFFKLSLINKIERNLGTTPVDNVMLR